MSLATDNQSVSADYPPVVSCHHCGVYCGAQRRELLCTVCHQSRGLVCDDCQFELAGPCDGCREAEPMSLPRIAWLSPSGYYRIVLTANGPTAHVQRLYPGTDNSHLPQDTLWALEVRSESDLLGNIQWRGVDRNGDNSHWREAFRELAASTGVFR